MLQLKREKFSLVGMFYNLTVMLPVDAFRQIYYSKLQRYKYLLKKEGVVI